MMNSRFIVERETFNGNEMVDMTTTDTRFNIFCNRGDVTVRFDGRIVWVATILSKEDINAVINHSEYGNAPHSLINKVLKVGNLCVIETQGRQLKITDNVKNKVELVSV